MCVVYPWHRITKVNLGVGRVTPQQRSHLSRQRLGEGAVATGVIEYILHLFLIRELPSFTLTPGAADRRSRGCGFQNSRHTAT